MRNIFDQYQQPENRLTHALATVLDQDRALIIPFLKWLGIKEVPKLSALQLTEQQVPGTLQKDTEELEQGGLPDAAVYSMDDWTVLFESKVQACINPNQVERHRNTAKRHGYTNAWIVLISVGEPTCAFPDRTIAVTWQDVYRWFNGRTGKSRWAKALVDYMKVFERRMVSQEYQIKGTITVFDGLRFDDDNPYTYREGKRLIRLLGDILQSRKDLHKIGVDPHGDRRSAITGKGSDSVWDFLPLEQARQQPFTNFPHFTMNINRRYASAAVTVPNGVKGGFRKKLISYGRDGFLEVIGNLERRLRPVLKRSNGAKPIIYASQRHFRSRSSPALIDARLETNLCTAFPSSSSRTKYQPQWLDAIYEVLVKRRSNIQFGVDVQYKYTCPRIRSAEAADLFADTWKALSPLIHFVLD